MKPRIGVYLSKRTAARLTVAARRREITRSALVEAAIDRYLASDDTSDAAMLAGRLTDLSGQVDQLDRNLGIVSEIVSLHARFNLSLAAELPAATRPATRRLEPARFDSDEQVKGCDQPRTLLAQETSTRTDAAAPAVTPRHKEGPSSGTSAANIPGDGASTWGHDAQEEFAAVREDGSNDTFPSNPARPVH
jgi:predicted transcriptional regulator